MTIVEYIRLCACERETHPLFPQFGDFFHVHYVACNMSLLFVDVANCLSFSIRSRHYKIFHKSTLFYMHAAIDLLLLCYRVNDIAMVEVNSEAIKC